jgi:hypothetical protein
MLYEEVAVFHLLKSYYYGSHTAYLNLKKVDVIYDFSPYYWFHTTIPTSD